MYLDELSANDVRFISVDRQKLDLSKYILMLIKRRPTKFTSFGESKYRQPRVSQGWPIGDGSGPRRPVKGVKHDQLANSSLPYCRYAGIVLLEEKIVSNSLINLQDMWVKDFIYIALACT